MFALLKLYVKLHARVLFIFFFYLNVFLQTAPKEFGLPHWRCPTYSPLLWFWWWCRRPMKNKTNKQQCICVNQ
jgi:hypothetical protein